MVHVSMTCLWVSIVTQLSLICSHERGGNLVTVDLNRNSIPQVFHGLVLVTRGQVLQRCMQRASPAQKATTGEHAVTSLPLEAVFGNRLYFPWRGEGEDSRAAQDQTGPINPTQ